jgi:MYXO-CTERM domain-containing protein
VTLRATAFDPEDRTLAGEAIAWSSSVDGELGTGTELVAEDLSAGGHVITITATDSDALTDSVTFELTMNPNVIQPQPDPELEATIDDVFAALAAGEDLSTIGGGDVPWLPIVLVVGGAALIGLAAFGLIRRSRNAAPPPAGPAPEA